MSLSNKNSLIQTASFALLIACMIGCTPSATNVSKSTGYEEDLSVHRPDYPAPSYNQPNTKQAPIKMKPEIEPTGHIKNELDSVLSAMILGKKNVKYINGFSIQVYSGNNRGKAADVKNQVLEISEEFNPKISYNQPNYKVKVGKYFSRFEANKDLVTLKKEFRQALLVPDKIPIK